MRGLIRCNAAFRMRRADGGCEGEEGETLVEDRSRVTLLDARHAKRRLPRRRKTRAGLIDTSGHLRARSVRHGVVFAPDTGREPFGG